MFRLFHASLTSVSTGELVLHFVLVFDLGKLGLLLQLPCAVFDTLFVSLNKSYFLQIETVFEISGYQRLVVGIVLDRLE